MNKKKPIDILQGKFRHFTGDVELDDDKNKKYDFEGSLDDFEIWLKNLKTETHPLMKQKELEWEKNSKELRDLIRKRQQRIEKENRIIKMKPLIQNEI